MISVDLSKKDSTMKISIGLLLSTLFLMTVSSCKTQIQNNTTEDILAYQPQNESELIQSILNSEDYMKLQDLYVNDKKYPMKDFQSIMDTLRMDNYRVTVKNDTKGHKKSLILKSL